MVIGVEVAFMGVVMAFIALNFYFIIVILVASILELIYQVMKPNL